MRRFSITKWFRDLAIFKKLYFIAAIVGIITLIEVLVYLVPINTLSAIRAFTRAEGILSKSQKNAVYNLELYAHKHDKQNDHDEQHYIAFQNYMKVLSGNHKALIEITKKKPDFETARQGFLEGRNQPEDIPGMIKLFSRFRNISFINKALIIWKEADSYLPKLISTGEKLHAEIISGSPSVEKIDKIVSEIVSIDLKLTRLGDEFSDTLAEGSRWIEKMILRVFLSITFILGTIILFFAISLNRTIRKELNELNRVAAIVTNGDYSERAKVYSQNEIGVVADSVNRMTMQLQKQIILIKQSEEIARKSEEQFKYLFENTSELIQSIHTADGKILYVNPAWLKTLEYTKEEVKELFLTNVIHPDNMEDYKIISQKIDKGEQIDHLEGAFITKTGKKIYIEGSIVCYLKEGIPYSTLGIFRNITQRKIADEKQAILATIVNYSDDAIISTTFDGTVKSWNRAAEKLFGYTGDEIIGKSVFIMSPPQRANEDPQLLEKIKSGIFIEHYETESQKKDGTIIPVEVSLSPIKDRSGNIIGVSKIVHDITKRKKTEEELKQKNYFLNAVLENIPAMIFMKNAKDLRYIFFSKAVEESLGHRKDELIGKNAYDLFPKEQADSFTFQDRDVLKQKEIFEIPEELVDTKNGKRWLHTRKIAIYDESADPIYLLGVSMDITERKKSEDKFKGLLESTPDGILIVDSKGIIQLVNSQTGNIFGYKKDEIIGKDLDILIPARFKGSHGQHFKAFFSHPRIRLMGDRSGVDLFGLRKDGTEFPIEISLGPIETSEGILVSAVIRDITEQKKSSALAISLAEEKTKAELEAKKAKEANQFKDRFLANMSHEIRTPMNAIIGFSDILANKNLGVVEKEYVATIKQAGENLLNIINDILDISKIEARMMSFEEHPFCLKDILKSVHSMLKIKAKEKHLELTFICDDDVPDNLLGDSKRLSQIIINIVGNAIKFTNKGKVQVNVKAHDLEGENTVIEFYVKDTGIGIQKDKLEHVFDRFWQADSNVTRKYGGTGLGLNIAKQLVDLQGGAMFVKSEFNVGSVFSFWIPYKKTNEILSAAVTKNEKFMMEDLKNLNMLMVEDNLLNVKLISSLFSENNLKLQVVENGKACIDKLKEYQNSANVWNENETTLGGFDIILMDIEMPIMNGYETAMYIRNEMKSNIPIIAMTANAMAGEREKCLRMGMNDYISKPVNANLLFEKIYDNTHIYELTINS